MRERERERERNEQRKYIIPRRLFIPETVCIGETEGKLLVQLLRILPQIILREKDRVEARMAERHEFGIPAVSLDPQSETPQATHRCDVIPSREHQELPLFVRCQAFPDDVPEGTDDRCLGCVAFVHCVPLQSSEIQFLFPGDQLLQVTPIEQTQTVTIQDTSETFPDRTEFIPDTPGQKIFCVESHELLHVFVPGTREGREEEKENE